MKLYERIIIYSRFIGVFCILESHCQPPSTGRIPGRRLAGNAAWYTDERKFDTK